MDSDDRIDEILGEWRERRDAGEPVAERDVILAHPEHADALRACFSALRVFASSVAASSATVPAPPLRAMAQGRYVGFRVSGEGGMGIVYWALDSDLGRQVAFKVVRPVGGSASGPTPPDPIALAPPAESTPDSPAFEALKARFLREARITAALEHPGIVPVYEVGETSEGVPYYTMRFVRGNRTLVQALAETPQEERLRLLDPFLKVCDTLRYAHSRGVIHRDLKPANVALGEYGEVVVIDWGLAREKGGPAESGVFVDGDASVVHATPAAVTAVGPVGTPGYMSPEAARGSPSEVDQRGDVYSLGAILFEILTGALPFKRTSFGELLHDLEHSDPPDPSLWSPRAPPELSAICLRALARSRDVRFPSVDELAAAIRGWQTRSARDAQIAAARRAATEGVAMVRSLGAEAPVLQLAAASHACRNVLELVPEDPEALAFVAELTRTHEAAVAKQIQRVGRRALRRVAIVALSTAVATAAVVVALLDAKRREVEIERDAKSAALDRETAERDSRERALRRAEGLRLTLEAKSLVSENPGLALLLALEGVERRRDLRSPGVLLDALAACREERTMSAGGTAEGAWLSPDGRRVAMSAVDGRVHVWDVKSGRESATLGGHRAISRHAAFDATGRLLVTASEDGTAVVWDVAAESAVVTLRGHEGAVCWAEFSPDGSTVATASYDGTARLWSAADGTSTAVLRGHRARVRSVRFDASGTRLLTSSEDNDARIWDARTGGLVATLAGHEGRVLDAQWRADGRAVVTASDDKSARVWDAATGEQRAKLVGHEGLVVSAAFSPDGARVLTASWDRTARLWDAASGAETARLAGHGHGLHGARFSRDGLRIVTQGSWDHEARVWDGADGRLLLVMRGHAGRLDSAEFTPDGTHLVTGSEDGTVRLWDIARPPAMLTMDLGEDGPPRCAALSPDGRWAAAVSKSGRLGIWNAATGEPMKCPTKERLRSVAFAPTSDRLATVSDKGEERGGMDVVGVVNPRLGGPAMIVVDNFVRSAEFSPDGTSVLVALDDRAELLVWEKGRVACYDAPGRNVAAHFVPDGSRVVVATDEGKFAVFDAKSGAKVAEGVVASGKIVDVAASPDGRRLVVSVSGGPTILWDVASGATIAEIARQEGSCRAVFSPDGRRVAAAGAPGEIRIASSASGRVLLTPTGHSTHVTSLSYTGDGRFLVSTSTDERTRVWDAATGEPVQEFAFGDGWVLGASIAADGSRMLTWTARGKLRIAPVDVVAAARRVKPRDLTAEEQARFGIGPRAEATLLLDGATEALRACRADLALAMTGQALREAPRGSREEGMLRYCEACADLLRAADGGARGHADVVAALTSLRRAVELGVDPVHVAGAGAPDVADPDLLDRLAPQDRADVVAAVVAAEKPDAAEVDAWLLEARDAASRGAVGEAICRFRRAVAADGARCGDALVELARAYCVRAASRTAATDRRRDIERALDWLDAAVTAGHAPSAETLAAPEWAPLREEPRFRESARRR